MLREYVWRGGTWQFEECERPEGAVPVEEAAADQRRPRDKARVPGKGRAAPAEDRGGDGR